MFPPNIHSPQCIHYEYASRACMMCGEDCDVTEEVDTGFGGPIELWCYCKVCKIDTFHPRVPIMSLRLFIDAVRSFQETICGRHSQSLLTLPKSSGLMDASQCELELSKRLAKAAKACPEDLRYITSHLNVEESGELLDALAACDEVLALDALADLLYTVLGTAVAFDLPIEEAFAEVHISNMSKRKFGDDNRLRDKGPNYKPPDIAGVLERYRKGQRSRSTVDVIRDDILRALKRDHVDVRGLTHEQRMKVEECIILTRG